MPSCLDVMRSSPSRLRLMCRSARVIVAPIEEIQLVFRNASGAREQVSFHDLVKRMMGESATRADLQISRAGDGELLLTSRQDGMIRMLVP